MHRGELTKDCAGLAPPAAGEGAAADVVGGACAGAELALLSTGFTSSTLASSFAADIPNTYRDIDISIRVRKCYDPCIQFGRMYGL
jgi:hypothetical protein